jgi:hypothetical protein
MAKTKDKIISITAGNEVFDDGSGYLVLFALTEKGRVLYGRFSAGSRSLRWTGKLEMEI